MKDIGAFVRHGGGELIASLVRQRCRSLVDYESMRMWGTKIALL